jgi:myosin heavy subunit
LSNLNFKGNEEDSSLEEGNQYADRVSEVLGISLHNLENLLCFKAIIDPITKKKIPQNLSQNMAEYNRETFAKIIYDRLFDWIVSRVNIEIKKPLTGQAKNFKSIGLLDIFGFEVFESNSFEQLCINFTNEKLQHHFNEHVFSLEMAAYKAEGLSCEAVVFSDNSAIIKLIEGKPLSLFGLLDDQCKFANGSDDAFLEKALSSFKNEKAFLSGPRFKGKIFGVAHFAGDVYYDVTNFVEKNRNSKNKDLEEIMASSSVGFIADLFDESQKKGITTKPEVSKSISGQFLEQLEDLVKSLNSSACSYIRCIKPNESMSAKVFDSELVCKQLRCAGMLEAIRIRRSGFPIRRAFDTFVSLYKLLFLQFNVKIGGPRQAIDQFIEALDKKGIIRASDKHLQLGKTKVFMKEHVKNKLDALLEQSLTIFATRIQRWVKHILKRAILRKRFKSRLLIQRWWRALLLGREVRLQVQNRLLCIKKIQKFLKTKLIPFRLKQLNSAARQSKNHLSHQTSSEQPTAKKEPNSAKKQGKSGDIKNKFNEIIRKNKSGENGPGRLSSPISEQEGNIDATYDLEDEIESHPKYIQMQIELQKAKRELEVFRNNGQVQLSTNSAQLFGRIW